MKQDTDRKKNLICGLIKHMEGFLSHERFISKDHTYITGHRHSYLYELLDRELSAYRISDDTIKFFLEDPASSETDLRHILERFPEIDESDPDHDAMLKARSFLEGMLRIFADINGPK